MSKLLDLAARCEAATAANFALECDIADAVKFDRQEEGPISRPPPNYTASIDAALALAPEDHFWSINMRGENYGYHACCASGDALHWREAASPALALCAAALRARAAMEDTGRHISHANASTAKGYEND